MYIYIHIMHIYVYYVCNVWEFLYISLTIYQKKLPLLVLFI